MTYDDGFLKWLEGRPADPQRPSVQELVIEMLSIYGIKFTDANSRGVAVESWVKQFQSAVLGSPETPQQDLISQVADVINERWNAYANDLTYGPAQQAAVADLGKQILALLRAFPTTVPAVPPQEDAAPVSRKEPDALTMARQTLALQAHQRNPNQALRTLAEAVVTLSDLRVHDYRAGYSAGFSHASNGEPMHDAESAALFLREPQTEAESVHGEQGGPGWGI